MLAEERNKLIQRIEDGVATWEKICSQLPPEALVWQPSQEKWSIKQITFHVADGFEATIQRVQTILAEDRPWVLAFDADQWAEERSYQQKPWSSALSSLKKQMQRFIDLISPLDDAMLQRTGQQRNIANILGLPNEVLTVADLLRFEVMHVEEHLSGVNDLIQLFVARTR